MIVRMALTLHVNDRSKQMNILDIGGGSGTDLCNVRDAFLEHRRVEKVHLYEIDAYPPNCEKAETQGICVKQVNVEHEALPYENKSMDIVIANQTMEHVKEIFWIVSEVSRVLRPHGLFIMGVPNLASLHNRLALLLGKQPPAILTLGPHVRGYTKEETIRFTTTDGYFICRETAGSGWYPFPRTAARWLANMIPSMAVSTFYCFERTGKLGNFIHVLDTRFFETPYYCGK